MAKLSKDARIHFRGVSVTTQTVVISCCAIGFMAVCGRCNVDEMDGATRKLIGVHKNFDPQEFDERFLLKISTKFAFDKELLQKIRWETSTCCKCVINNTS